MMFKKFPEPSEYLLGGDTYHFYYQKAVDEWAKDTVTKLEEKDGMNLALSKTGRAYRQGQLDIIKPLLEALPKVKEK